MRRRRALAKHDIAVSGGFTHEVNPPGTAGFRNRASALAGFAVSRSPDEGNLATSITNSKDRTRIGQYLAAAFQTVADYGDSTHHHFVSCSMWY
jgi:hypothetical protein